MIWRPIFITGLSDVIGSWKTIAISVPHSARSWSLLAPDELLARRRWPTRCGRRCCAVRRPMIERASTVLPEPDSPTTPSVLPRSRLKVTPSTALTMPAGGVEVRPEVVDHEERSVVRRRGR